MPAPKKNAKSEAIPAVEQPAVETTPAVEQQPQQPQQSEQPQQKVDDMNNSNNVDEILMSTPVKKKRTSVLLNIGQVAKIIRGDGLIQDGKVVIPENYNLMERLKQVAQVKIGKVETRISDVWDNLDDEDKLKTEEAIKVAFANNVKMARFSQSTHKVADVRASLRQAVANAKNDSDRKRAIGLLSILPRDTYTDENGVEHDKYELGGNLIAKRERSARGTEANALAAMNFPQPDDQFQYLDAKHFGIVFDTTSKTSQVARSAPALENYGEFNL